MLWPRPTAAVDLAALPPVGGRELRFVVDGTVMMVDAAEYARITTPPCRWVSSRLSRSWKPLH